jgi:hypothetical protein
MMPRTKRILRRRSGVRNALAKALSTCLVLLGPMKMWRY